MSDWLKIGLTILGVAVTVYVMVQQHDFRIERLESGFEKHLTTHETQYREIEGTLTQIQIGLGRLSGQSDQSSRTAGVARANQ